MDKFLNVTLEGDENGYPYLINPNQITRIWGDKEFVTCIEVSTGEVVRVAEPITEILKMLDKR